MDLCQGGLDWALRKNFFTERVLKPWNRLPRVVVAVPGSVGKLCRCGTKGHGFSDRLDSVRLTVGLGDLAGQFQPL